MQPSAINLASADHSFAALCAATWRIVLLLVWAAWWGGLCFYAVVVVPVGTDAIGSIEQGFITQRVTQWHNALSWVFLVCWVIESLRRRSKACWGIGTALAIINIALVAWHSHLSGMMDFQKQTVPSGFYSQHAVYLWITAAQWVMGIALSIWLCPMPSQPSQNSSPKRTTDP